MDIDAITYLTELGGRVARALDDENEDDTSYRRDAISARGASAGIQAVARIHVGGGSIPTRKSKRAVTPLKEATR